MPDIRSGLAPVALTGKPMLAFIRTSLSDNAANTKGRILGLYAVLAAANLIVWAWALIAFRDTPVLLGTALLAYSLGLRHAVDADHIAAIDNVTRKLMQEGKQPVAVGFYFSLGHSTVVLLLTTAIAATTYALQGQFEGLKEIAGLIGTSISALFLFAIAIVNIFVLIAVCRTFRAVRRGEPLVEDDLNAFLAQRGLLSRLFRPLFRLISKSWHMYPIGFLFGIGFDTVTEMGLLGIAGAEAARGLSAWSILVFPALFTAGMSLVDTTDSVLMLGAYGWAFVKPIRKLYYNMTITFVSVLVAVLVGGIEALGLIGDQLGLEGGFWTLISSMNDNFGSLGYVIIGVFAASWIISAVVYRIKRYDEVEVVVN
jgi:nickel/cobalt transporter (NiCoT) family protein